MIQIALLEDEQEVRQKLAGYLARFTQETGERFAVRTFEDGQDIVAGYSGEYDVIFMDIQMKNMDGMTAAEEIRKVDQAVSIVFITNLSAWNGAEFLPRRAPGAAAAGESGKKTGVGEAELSKCRQSRGGISAKSSGKGSHF